MARSGYVLAGGRSRRMGCDKARLPFRGSTLAGAVASAVAAAAGSAILIGHPELDGIPDLYPGEGPLGGILTALRHTTAEWNLIVACDMPELTPDFLRRLLTSAEQQPCSVLLPQSGGRAQPLCAVYHRDTGPEIARQFQAGVRKVTSALEELPVVHLDVGENLWFQNVNTPEDWTVYAGQ